MAVGYTYYSYLAFITPDSEADLSSLQAKLQAFFARLNTETKPQLTQAGNRLTIAFGAYRFYVYYATGAHVLIEAAESAADQPVDYADQPIDAARFATCNRRFELHGDPDPSMDYFNEHLYILEGMEEFSGVIILQSA